MMNRREAMQGVVGGAGWAASIRWGSEHHVDVVPMSALTAQEHISDEWFRAFKDAAGKNAAALAHLREMERGGSDIVRDGTGRERFARWFADRPDYHRACVYCRRRKSTGHAPTCSLALAIQALGGDVQWQEDKT